MTARRYPGEVTAVVGTVHPRVLSTTATSDRVELGEFAAYVAVVSAGVVATSVDARIVQADAASGGTTKDLPGASITRIGADDDNTTAVIEFDGMEFDQANGFRWFEVSLTGVGTNIVGVTVLGVFPRYAPATDDQSVNERVVI